jgi:hypothetical protein
MTPGTRILVCEGASRGDVGVVLGKSQFAFDGEDCLVVQLDDRPYESVIRASFLCPEPERSDEDVMAFLRRTTCP